MDSMTIDTAKAIEDQIRERIREARKEGREEGKAAAESKIRQLTEAIEDHKRELQERYLGSGAAETSLNLNLAGLQIRTIQAARDSITFYFNDSQTTFRVQAKGLRWTFGDGHCYGYHDSPMSPGYSDDKGTEG